MEELKKYIQAMQDNYIKLARKDKSKSKGVNAILTATTLIVMKINEIEDKSKLKS